MGTYVINMNLRGSIPIIFFFKRHNVFLHVFLSSTYVIINTKKK